MKLVTIKDVARESGASSVAVSLVLNGHGKTQRIAVATSERIIEAAKRLNYQPNRAAISLRSKKSNLIGLAMRTVNHPTQSALSQRLLQRLAALKFEVLVEIIEDFTSRELEKLLHYRPEALIVGPLYGINSLAPSVYKMMGDSYPLIGFEGWGAITFDLVTCDLGIMVETSIRHLRAQGHRKIGCVIGGSNPQIETKYRALMGGSGGGFHGALHVIYGTYENGELFALNMPTGNDAPTAYVFQDPCFATGFLRGAWKRGLRIPDDVAFVLTGYADFCDHLPIKPTTVTPDQDEMADLVVSLLVSRHEGDLLMEKQRKYLVPHLRIGESCGGRFIDKTIGAQALQKPALSLGFTLIELLTVLAILSLLIALLVPAIVASREAANRMKCIENLRGIGVGIMMYISDNDGRLPAIDNSISQNGALSYAARHMTYSTPSTPVMIGEAPPFTDGYTSIKLYDCPSDKTRKPEVDFWPYWGANNNISYAFNYLLLCGPGASSGQIRIVNFAKPHQDILFGEVDGYVNYYITSPFDASFGWCSGGMAHHRSNGSNFLFLDGHCEFVTLDYYKKILRYQGDIYDGTHSVNWSSSP